MWKTHTHVSSLIKMMRCLFVSIYMSMHIREKRERNANWRPWGAISETLKSLSINKQFPVLRRMTIYYFFIYIRTLDDKSNLVVNIYNTKNWKWRTFIRQFEPFFNETCTLLCSMCVCTNLYQYLHVHFFFPCHSEQNRNIKDSVRKACFSRKTATRSFSSVGTWIRFFTF